MWIVCRKAWNSIIQVSFWVLFSFKYRALFKCFSHLSYKNPLINSVKTLAIFRFLPYCCSKHNVKLNNSCKHIFPVGYRAEPTIQVFVWLYSSILVMLSLRSHSLSPSIRPLPSICIGAEASGVLCVLCRVERYMNMCLWLYFWLCSCQCFCFCLNKWAEWMDGRGGYARMYVLLVEPYCCLDPFRLLAK